MRDGDVIVVEKAFVEELPLAQCLVILWECEWRKHKTWWIDTDTHTHTHTRKQTHTLCDTCRGTHTPSAKWNRPYLVMSIVKHSQYQVCVWSAYLLLSCCLWCICLASAYQALGYNNHSSKHQLHKHTHRYTILRYLDQGFGQVNVARLTFSCEWKRFLFFPPVPLGEFNPSWRLWIQTKLTLWKGCCWLLLNCWAAVLGAAV